MHTQFYSAAAAATAGDAEIAINNSPLQKASAIEPAALQFNFPKANTHRQCATTFVPSARLQAYIPLANLLTV